MPEPKPQSAASHAKWDPSFHFFLAPALLALIIFCLVLLVRHPNLPHVLFLIIAICLFVTAGRMRAYSLKVQDRVIRLEERLRLMALAPNDLQPRIHQLTEDQLIGLRFASDEELPTLARRALDDHLTKKQIKASIAKWRPDHWRV